MEAEASRERMMPKALQLMQPGQQSGRGNRTGPGGYWEGAGGEGAILIYRLIVMMAPTY